MRLAIVTASLLTGGAVAAGIYWAFLSTPESTVSALILSAVLAVLFLAMLSLTINIAIAQWSRHFRAVTLRGALVLIPSIVPAALVVALFWWIAGRADTWVALRSGAINAWLIARFGWDDVSWLFSGIGFFTIWLRWVLGGVLALSLMAAIANSGWPSAMRPAWIGRSLRPRALALATAWFVLLVVLPWIYLVPWRPGWVPATTAEMAFIIIKLAIAAVLMAAGMALMIKEIISLPTTASHLPVRA